MKRNKAWRRHHRQRMIRRARKVLKIEGYHDSVITKLARRRADNIKACSCAACTVYWPSHRDDAIELSGLEQLREASEIED